MAKLIMVPVLSLMVWALYLVDYSGAIQATGNYYPKKADCNHMAEAMEKLRECMNEGYQQKAYGQKVTSRCAGWGVSVEKFGCTQVEWRPTPPPLDTKGN